MSKFHVIVSRFIPVPAQQLFDLVADPSKHPLFDGSGTVKNSAASRKLALGETFSMDMKFGAKYTMVNTVIEYEEGRTIAWKPGGDYLWRYRFEPATGGTHVTEEWDASTSKRRFMMGLLGFPRRNRQGITQTLERLHHLAVNSQH